MCPRSVPKNASPDPSFAKVNLNFLHSSGHFNGNTVFAVIVSFLNKSVHGFNNIRNGRVKTRFQIVNSDDFESSFSKNITFVPLHFGKLMGRIFLKLQPPIDIPDPVAHVKSL